MRQLLVVLLLIVIIGMMTVSGKKSRYVFSLADSPSRTIRPSGNITRVTLNELPILKGLSIRHLILEPSGVREPHWHANANELGYCLRGSALVTIFGNHGEYATFTITGGEMFFIPSGALHHIENLDNSNGSSVAEFILAFSHESPKDFDLSSAFSAMTDAVLGNTFQLPSSAFQNIEHRKTATVIGTKESSETNRGEARDRYPNKFKFNAEDMSPPLNVPEGSAKTVTKRFWPILEDIAMFSLRISTTGMREPHWHPETAEMGYVVQGHARMTILSPGIEQELETYTLKPGDMYFIPRAYPHQIENIGNEQIKFLVFFDQPLPGDIGFTGSFSAYSREVLAATLQCSTSQLPNFPFYPENLLIVHRNNPVDP